MELNDFIEKFCEALEMDEPEEVKADTFFHEMDSWSSLASLRVIAMADEEYEVELKGADIRGAETVEDLFNIVKSRKG